MMKLETYKTFLLILITFLFVMTTSPLIAQVYKIVDEDGNVTYTDQPPSDGSKPIELRPISIIEAPTYETAPSADEATAEGEDDKKMSLKNMRRNYQDFAIVSPRPEESVWHPDGPVTVAWSARYQLQIGMKVTVYMDGNKQAATTDQVIQISDMERGEHTVTAELTDSRNRKIATAPPVTFFIQRPGLNTNRARRRPGGGS